MKGISFADNRKVLVFDNQKFNLQEVGKEYEPKAQNPASGTIDLCLISDTPLKVILKKLEMLNISVKEGPTIRTGRQAQSIRYIFVTLIIISLKF